MQQVRESEYPRTWSNQPLRESLQCFRRQRFKESSFLLSQQISCFSLSASSLLFSHQNEPIKLMRTSEALAAVVAANSNFQLLVESCVLKDTIFRSNTILAWCASTTIAQRRSHPYPLDVHLSHKIVVKLEAKCCINETLIVRCMWNHH